MFKIQALNCWTFPLDLHHNFRLSRHIYTHGQLKSAQVTKLRAPEKPPYSHPVTSSLARLGVIYCLQLLHTIKDFGRRGKNETWMLSRDAFAERIRKS
jgi:hypothetical protein